MSLPERRNPLPRLSLFRGPVIIAIAVLLGLLVVTRILKTGGVPFAGQTDTLNVTTSGLYLNRQKIEVYDLWAHYSKTTQNLVLVVRIDTTLPWGETWVVVDTLKRLSKVRPNLKISWIDDLY
jgi:hypothetical protein